MEQSDPHVTDAEREFYTLEYERIASVLEANESMGEGRVTLFFGVWSAAVAGVAALTTMKEQTPPSVLVVGGLCMVLAIGVVTAMRIVKRNHTTDSLVDARMRVRTILTHGIRAWPVEQPAHGALKLKPRRRWGRGGLLEVVGLANATVLPLAVVAWSPANPSYVLMAIAFVGSLVAQTSWARVINDRDFARRQDAQQQFDLLFRPHDVDETQSRRVTAKEVSGHVDGA